MRNFTRDELEIALRLLQVLAQDATYQERQTIRKSRELIEQMLIRIDDEKSTH
jgi:hypothetical protein